MSLVTIRADVVFAQLTAAAEHVKRQAQAVVERTARELVVALRAAYPEGPTGRLRRQIVAGLAPRQTADPILRVYRVRASAPHVHIYEQGTRPRVDPTRRNASRGRSPAHGPIFARLAAASRRRMVEAISDIITRSMRV